MKNIPMKLSGVLMNPTIQATLAQISASLPIDTPPTEPLEMKATIEISKELKREEREATKDMEEEVDDYHEHPKYRHLKIDKVVSEGEETQ